MNRNFTTYKRVTALFLAIITLVAFCLSTQISAVAEKTYYDNIANVTSIDNDYRSYYSAHSKTKASEQSIEMLSASGADDYEYGNTVNININVPNDGLYNFSMLYKSNGTQDIMLRISVDGSVPFYEAENITFPCYWVNKDEKWQENKGDQFTPEQVVYDKACECLAQDYSGENELPYYFYLSKGEHTIGIDILQGSLKISKLMFKAPENPQNYKKPQDILNGNKAQIIIEGEYADYKNSKALIPQADTASALVHPSDYAMRKLNYVGGSNWSGSGKTLFWNFDVDKDGYYSLGFNYRQSQVVGGVAYRSLKIDGVSPFKEAQRIKFKYGSDWQYFTYSNDDGEPYYIYLKKGSHTLSLSVTAGAISDVYSSLQSATVAMGNMYVNITKIVGETVDIYRSYELFKQIPNFNDDLKAIISQLNAVSDNMLKLQENTTGSSVSIVKDAIRVIEDMVNKPYSAHKYKSQFYDAYTNLSALLTDMVNMPLDLDRIVLTGSGTEYNSKDVSIINKWKHSFMRFLVTFTDSYGMVFASESKGEPLNIWINWGRDQAEALNNIIQDDFVHGTGISVNLKLVNASIIQAILSGKGPDCLIQMSRTEPVNLAMRGALEDLKQFDDYDEVVKRFLPDAEVPYTYRDGVYALPVTQSFYLMFMRTDILDSLGIQEPQTWDEFITAASVLQRNNLQAVIPYTQLADSGTVNSGVGGLTLFPTLLLQKGLKIYNSEQTATALADIDQLQTFVNWTNLYTKYKFPKISNFYNRFRIGSAPLGIAPYTLYTELKAAAPEIAGRWTVALIPGTETADGTVNHTSASWGAGCAITKLSENPQNAWEFLKWWTSTETQLKYSSMLESVLGPLGRVATANVEAFSQMDWDVNMYKQISEQQKLTAEIEEIPGGYYTARGIDQAFWSVVESGKDPTEMIKKWGTIVDGEIERKKAEYEK